MIDRDLGERNLTEAEVKRAREEERVMLRRIFRWEGIERQQGDIEVSDPIHALKLLGYFS